MKLKEDQIKVMRSLSKTNTAKILASLVQNNARSPSQLAVELNLQPTQVHRALNELYESKLITKQVKNKTPLASWVFYRPTAKGKQASRMLE